MALARVELALSGFFNPELDRSSTAGWPLVSLAEAVAVAALYLGCTLAGSALMAGRQPFEGPVLRLAMIAYNAGGPVRLHGGGDGAAVRAQGVSTPP